MAETGGHGLAAGRLRVAGVLLSWLVVMIGAARERRVLLAGKRAVCRRRLARRQRLYATAVGWLLHWRWWL